MVAINVSAREVRELEEEKEGEREGEGEGGERTCVSDRQTHRWNLTATAMD
jgi:hypothetical protein